jgi:arginine utilization regulatory protein
MNEVNFTFILDQLDEGVHVVDLQGNTVYYNKAMGRMEGIAPKEVLGQSLLRHFPSLSKETSTLWYVLQTHNALEQVSQTYLNPRGDKITSINNTYPLYVQGELVGAVEVAKDLSRVAQLTEQVVQLQSELHPPSTNQIKKKTHFYTFNDIVTQSEVMYRILEKARRASNSGVSVLITGETGTGKEMVAQSIHTYSSRADGPFIAQNCAALPESLLEGILFGTVRGSFTGAVDRPGLFEQAQGGTLLLDEIDSMGMNLQAKILRVLQEGRIRRLGDIREKEIDVRILATTNQPPEESVRQGRIRADLYYRLNVLEIALPPLRERPKDIELLAQHFLKQLSQKHHRSIPTIDFEVLLTLKRHDWPGNVRELAHIIEGGVVISDRVFGVNELPNYLQAKALAYKRQERQVELPSKTLQESVHQLEVSMIRAALDKTQGNLTRAAEHLGISRQVLQYKLRNLNQQDV